jgi:hypothetical protein
MGLTGVVHVKAHLLDHVGDVGPGEGEILESPSQAAIGSRVADRGPHVRGGHGLSVNRSGARLAVAHASTLKDVMSILALVEEEAVGPLLYWDAEEVVERAEVLHRKLLLESCSGTLEKIWAQGGENDVVDVEQQVRSVDAAAVDEQRGVRLGLHEAQGDQVGEDAVIPCSWRLLQTIEGLVEPAHQLRVCGSTKSAGWEQ